MNGINVMLNFFDNFSNGIDRTVNATEKAANSFDNLGNSANMVNVNTSAIDNMANSASGLSNQIDNWTSKIGNYDKSAMEAVYTTEELVQMGYKTSNALNNMSNSSKNIKPPLEQATEQQEKLNRTINNGSSNMNGLSSKVGNLLKTYLGFQAVKQGFTSTIGGAMKMQQQLFTIQGIMGNTDVGTAYFNNLQKKANESVFAFEDFAQNARNYMQFTKSTDTLDKLSNLSERLTLVDPTQGLQGAGFALKEMMSGDGTSLKERFGFGKADIEILKASKDMSSFLDQFDSLLNKKGFTEDMLAKYNQSSSAQFDNLKSNMVTSMGQAGNGALEALNPLITRMNQAFSNGYFDSFFNSISVGLTIFASATIQAANGIAWLSHYLDVLFPIILGVASAFGIYKGAIIGYNIVQGISNGIEAISIASKAIHSGASIAEAAAIKTTTGAQVGLNTAMLACPITWIIIGIIAIIAIFYAAVAAVNHFAGTTWSATGIICGIITTAGAFIGNIILGLSNFIIVQGITLYNLIATFANFFATVFNDPVAAIANLFAGLFDTICGIVQSAASMIDTVLGSDLSGAVSGFQGKVDDYVNSITADSTVTVMEKLDASNYTLAGFDYGKSWDTGYNFGAGIDNKIGGIFGGLGSTLNNLNGSGLGADLDSWNKAQGPGNLAFGNDDKKNLKNINDKIDVSNEHLEMLTDLASEQSISNFVTLTPTVQITTGDIREEADINKIISSIETYMENELQNSAEGVYA